MHVGICVHVYMMFYTYIIYMHSIYMHTYQVYVCELPLICMTIHSRGSVYTVASIANGYNVFHIGY